MRLVYCVFLVLISSLAFSQSDDIPKIHKKAIGQETLAVNLGVFSSWYDGTYKRNLGFGIGIEKRRQKLMIGPIFGQSYYNSSSYSDRGLNGFLVDYSFVFFHPVKQADVYLLAQFQYIYQDRIIHYGPPAQDLVLSSRYIESYYGTFGFGLRLNILKSLNVFSQFGIGFQRQTQQRYYPYGLSANHFYRNVYLDANILIGISYSFPTKKKVRQ